MFPCRLPNNGRLRLVDHGHLAGWRQRWRGKIKPRKRLVENRSCSVELVGLVVDHALGEEICDEKILSVPFPVRSNKRTFIRLGDFAVETRFNGGVA